MTKKQRRAYKEIANDLGYSYDVLQKLDHAKNVIEAENILADARKKGDYRYGKKEN